MKLSLSYRNLYNSGQVLEITLDYGQAAPSVRLCHAQIPTGFGQMRLSARTPALLVQGFQHLPTRFARLKSRQAVQQVSTRSMTMPILTPTSINTQFADGPLFTFEASEIDLLDSGLIELWEVPSRRPRCKYQNRTGHELVKAYRLADGRVRLTISAHLALKRDLAFVRFLTKVSPLIGCES